MESQRPRVYARHAAQKCLESVRPRFIGHCLTELRRGWIATHKVHLEMELERGENLESQINAIGTVGERLLVSVHYLDDSPESQQGAP